MGQVKWAIWLLKRLAATCLWRFTITQASKRSIKLYGLPERNEHCCPTCRRSFKKKRGGSSHSVKFQFISSGTSSGRYGLIPMIKTLRPTLGSVIYAVHLHNCSSIDYFNGHILILAERWFERCVKDVVCVHLEELLMSSSINYCFEITPRPPAFNPHFTPRPRLAERLIWWQACKGVEQPTHGQWVIRVMTHNGFHSISITKHLLLRGWNSRTDFRAEYWLWMICKTFSTSKNQIVPYVNGHAGTGKCL